MNTPEAEKITLPKELFEKLERGLRVTFDTAVNYKEVSGEWAKAVAETARELMRLHGQFKAK